LTTGYGFLFSVAVVPMQESRVPLSFDQQEIWLFSSVNGRVALANDRAHQSMKRLHPYHPQRGGQKHLNRPPISG
jgi:hypothetical protein